MTAARIENGRARGRPLVMLVVLLGGWVFVRAALWQSPFPPLDRFPAFATRSHAPARGTTAVPGDAKAAGNVDLSRDFLVPTAPSLGVAAKGAPPAAPLLLSAYELPEAPLPERHILGQQLLLAAALAHMQMPPEIAAYFAPPDPASEPRGTLAAPAGPAGRPAPSLPSAKRWSADGWLLLRRDSTGALAAGEPSYGRSQAGGVLRYRLAPSSAHRPVAYARATGALAGPGEAELAIGLSARPLAGLPVSVAAEVRAYDGPAHREVRPAAFAVTELPPAKLPFGLRGELYAQAGYVGGRFATAFVDGQTRVDGSLASLGSASEVRLGVGLWGGAQKHTARLDVGPSATVSFRLGPTQSRLAVDYRWRVAGNAEPGDGPALTISAGF
jgi:hypothetical protein